MDIKSVPRKIDYDVINVSDYLPGMIDVIQKQAIAQQTAPQTDQKIEQQLLGYVMDLRNAVGWTSRLPWNKYEFPVFKKDGDIPAGMKPTYDYMKSIYDSAVQNRITNNAAKAQERMDKLVGYVGGTPEKLAQAQQEKKRIIQ